MQCQRCHFENMPGQQRCFKCGSVLESQGAILNVHPPRMAGWKRPWRGLFRVLRKRGGRLKVDKLPDVPMDWWPDYRDGLWGLVLSIIPGFAHFLYGHFKRIRNLLIAWFVCMSLSAALFSTPWGWALFGIGGTIHAWIALDAGLREKLAAVRERLIALLFLFALFFIGYYILVQVLFPSISFQRIAFGVSPSGVHSGDTLLLRSLGDHAQSLARGDFVSYQGRAINAGGTWPAVGQVVALPHETVKMDSQGFHVNGTPLGLEQFPVPHWMRTWKNEVTLGPNQYFITTAYHRRGAADLPPGTVERLCLISKQAIESRATMLWWPLTRRHRLDTQD